MASSQISLTMVVHNESHRLAPMIAWHRPLVDEVVIVVQESDDDTLDVAREYADIVIQHPCYGYCERSRSAASRAARYDAQLVLDADEQLTIDCAMMLPVLARNLGVTCHGWRLRRRFWLDGRLEFAGDCQHRLIYRPSVLFLDEIHTEPQTLVGWQSIKTFGTHDQHYAIEHVKTSAEQLLDEDRCNRLLSDGGLLAHDPLRAIKLALNVHRTNE